MKRQMKKLISMILAMAMVVTSINFTPKNVSAEDDGSGWTTISNMRWQRAQKVVPYKLTVTFFCMCIRKDLQVQIMQQFI